MGGACTKAGAAAAQTIREDIGAVLEWEPRPPPKSPAVKLGVVRLDYDYPPANGDIDCPASFNYQVVYRVVPGLTFEMCQSGKLTDEVKVQLDHAIKFLIHEGCHCITGDCGFMMYFQKDIRRLTHKYHAVCMSSLAQLPAVTCAYGVAQKIAIFTANSVTLEPMRDLIKEECGVDPNEERFVIVGCQDVPGFEAVALGEQVDVEKVMPGIVAKARETLKKHPDVGAFLFECTELPPYSDAVRAATGRPVYDSITCCDHFIAGFRSSANFGLTDWRESFDGAHHHYIFGENLSKEERAKLVNGPAAGA